MKRYMVVANNRFAGSVLEELEFELLSASNVDIVCGVRLLNIAQLYPTRNR